MTLDEDPLVALLREAEMPVTREAWISLAYGRNVPTPWTQEEESDVPDELQDWTKIEVSDD